MGNAIHVTAHNSKCGRKFILWVWIRSNFTLAMGWSSSSATQSCHTQTHRATAGVHALPSKCWKWRNFQNDYCYLPPFHISISFDDLFICSESRSVISYDCSIAHTPFRTVHGKRWKSMKYKLNKLLDNCDCHRPRIGLTIVHTQCPSTIVNWLEMVNCDWTAIGRFHVDR